MILKYKYHSDSSLLEAYRSYTVPQHNSLSDTIIITSTASDAEKYNYCLEFICYNVKSIPKAQYITPILNCFDGVISFTVPNNLTEFAGHVDMQLTGYDPDDNSVVFKSISKNCKAFDVEASICVLENDLSATPNVLTEVTKQLEELRRMHQDIIDEAMKQYGEQLLDEARKIKWHLVRFYNDGKLIDEKYVILGDKITPPKYTLPEYCEVVGGWYNPATERLWDMETDRVEGETNLYLNFKTDDLLIYQGQVAYLGNHSGAHIYIPEYYDGYKVTAIAEIAQGYIPKGAHIHLCSNMQDLSECGELLFNDDVGGLYFPDIYPDIISRNGQLYMKHDGLWFLLYAPINYGEIKIWEGCEALSQGAITNRSGLREIVFPKGITGISSHSIESTDIEELTLPAGIGTINDYAVYNNFRLKKIILEGDICGTLTNYTFINEDSQGNITRPTLYVQPQHYATYKAKRLAYEIKIVGQEFFDGRYAPIGE